MVGPYNRIPLNHKPMRQRVTPAKPQPAVHFHCTGAVQACPLKRQNPVQGPIGQGQQFLARDHRHRATVRGGFVRRCSGIPIRIASSRRHVIHRLLAHQHRPLRGLVPNQRHRVGNHLIPNLQWHIWNHPDRRRRATQQHRLGYLRVIIHAKLSELCSHVLQPAARTLRLDAVN
ncbi:hypothetical protein PS663_05757 [Pseudomonas fluorescens]|nr:hypothetical protein PS663_05757 [Pseudomonas fluorescens]